MVTNPNVNRMAQELFEVERMGKTVVLNLRRGLREIEFDKPPQDAFEVLELVRLRTIENIVVDCHDIDFLRSTALGFFVSLSQRITGKGGKVAFCNVSAKTAKILRATKLDKIWSVCPSRVEAIEAVEGE